MKDGTCAMCEKGGMHGDLCGQHHWMHVIIKIAVAILIFWAGVQFGELKSAIRNAYYGMGYGNYGMMSGYSGRQNQFYVAPGMTTGWSYTTTATTTKK